ncbi:MAG: hypothetical protein ACYCZN_01635 [Candidatus Dormibacteria bacterium]
MQTNSLVNEILAGGKDPIPQVGMGATILLWTDRVAGTIVEIVRFKSGPHKGAPRKVVVQRDRAVRTDGNGMSESQTYKYERDSHNSRETFHCTRGGKWKSEAGLLCVGWRLEYHDYSF